MRLPAALFALLLLPLAAAQAPTQPQACAIAADAPAAPAPVAAGETTTVTLTVRNPGTLAATVSVAATTAEAGWAVTRSPPASTVGAGGSQSFAFSVRADEAAAPSATVLFSVNAACDPAGPLPTCPANACQASASQQVTLSYAAPAGIRLPLLDQLAFPLEYLIAGVLLVAVGTAIPLALRTRKPRGGIRADCPEPLKMIKAGRGTSFPVEVRNLADHPAHATIQVSPVPEGWSAFVPVPEIQLAAKEARSLWLMVRAPPGAQPGASAEVELRMRTSDGVDLPPLRVRAEVDEA